MENNINLDLEDLGLGNLENIDLFHKEEAKAPIKKKTTVSVAEEKDIIYEKTYTCPVCDQQIKAKTVKTGKNKLASSDTDLRPIYKDVDSSKYDTVVCSICGYGALARYFVPLSDRQIKEFRDKVAVKFTGLNETDTSGIYSYDDAIKRYKLVLLSCMVKNAKASEKAYTCLKLAWTLRGKQESLPDDHPDINLLKEEELKFLKNAISGFEMALANESMPICDMDESTLDYLLADLYRRTGNQENSMRLLSKVITSRNASSRLKDRARELKELIK